MNDNSKVIKFPSYLANSNYILKSESYKSSSEVSGLINNDKSDSYEVEASLDVDEEEEDNELNNIDDILLKYIDSLDKKYDALKKDMVESEKRITQNNKDLEDRLEKRYIETNNNINKLIDKIDTLDSNLDSKLEKMNEKIDSNNKFIISISISTILGIAAMVITVILTR